MKLTSLSQKLHSSSSETQTSVENEDSVSIPCNLCLHVATYEEELTWHMGEDHGKKYIDF